MHFKRAKLREGRKLTLTWRLHSQIMGINESEILQRDFFGKQENGPLKNIRISTEDFGNLL